MSTDLEALLSLDPRELSLEWFLGCCLTEASVWDSPRTSDGINGIERIFERSPDVLRVRGQIWEIDQTLHPYWLEIVRDGQDDRFTWSVYYDVAKASRRQVKNALDSHDRPEEIEWRATVMGEAIVSDSKLAIVPDSTRVQVRDMPEPAPYDHRQRRRRLRP